MKIFFGYFYLMLCIALVASCRRAALPNPKPPLGSIPIKLYCDGINQSDNLNYGKQVELIVNEPGGTQLLDSLVPLNSTIEAVLHTNQKVVDVTTIVYDITASTYNIVTYKAVDPRAWNTATDVGHDIQDENIGSVPAAIHYINLPTTVTNEVVAADEVNANAGTDLAMSATNPQLDHLNVNYGRQVGNYMYLLFPELGLYHFDLPASNNDTVDISHMDSAIRPDYYKPGYQYTACNLVGVMDTTDLKKAVILFYPSFGSGFDTSAIQHFCYPPTLVQKYELRVYANTYDKKDYVSYYTYGNNVPSTMPFPDSTSYQLNSMQATNFSVAFPGTRPTYYWTVWFTNSGIKWTMISSPDSTTQYPLTTMAALKSRMLPSNSGIGLFAGRFGYATVAGMDYLDYFSYACDTLSVVASRPASVVTYYRNF